MDSVRRPAFATIALAAVVLCSQVGCETASAPPAAPPPPPSAEERFENFLNTLKSSIQDPAIRDGAAITSYGSGPGTPLTDWSTTIDHEYTAAEGDDPARAVVTLTTKSTVTVVLPSSKPNDDSDSKPKRPGQDSQPEGYAEIEALVKPAAPSIAERSGSSIQTLPGEQVTRLDLEFRDGKWALLTELDDQNEPFTSSAIRYALKRQ